MFRRSFIGLLCLLLLLPHSVLAQDVPTVSAYAAYVMDMASGTVLFEKNASSPHAIASTTKLMTCLLACEAEIAEETVTVTAEMLAGLEGTSMNLKAGDTVTVQDLLIGAMLASGNDAANALAVAVSGSKDMFVRRMNEKALLLGMTHTHFATPSGLDNGDNHSSASDMALLAREALKNERLAAIAAMPRATVTVSGVKRQINNHNKLLSRDSHFIGLKTGYTKKAGRCLVSAYRYEKQVIICVTLGDPNDWDDHVRLTDYAKRFYKECRDSVTLNIPLVGAEKESVKATYAYQICACEELTAEAYYYPFCYLPIHEGDTLGYVRLRSGGIITETVPIIASESVTNEI